MARPRSASRVALALAYVGVAVVVAGAFLVRARGTSALWVMGCGIAMVVASTFLSPRGGAGPID